MSGYLKSQRDRFKHHLFRNEKYCRGYAWDWLVAQAVWKDTTVEVKGKTIRLKRGQLCHSIRFIAGAWNWDKAAVSRYLTRLKTETMVDTHTETGQTVITICNYDTYQGEGLDAKTVSETPDETEVRQQRDSSETKKKKEKKEKKENIADILASRCSSDVAADFVEHRRQIKRPLTELAAKRMVAKLEGHPDPDGVLNLSIENGWQGIFPEKVKASLRVVGDPEMFGAFGRIPVRG